MVSWQVQVILVPNNLSENHYPINFKGGGGYLTSHIILVANNLSKSLSLKLLRGAVGTLSYAGPRSIIITNDLKLIVGWFGNQIIATGAVNVENAIVCDYKIWITRYDILHNQKFVFVKN